MRWNISSVHFIRPEHADDRMIDFVPSRFGIGHVRLGRLVTAIGIGSSTETTHSALLHVPPKVFVGVQFATANLAEEMMDTVL